MTSYTAFVMWFERALWDSIPAAGKVGLIVMEAVAEVFGYRAWRAKRRLKRG